MMVLGRIGAETLADALPRKLQRRDILGVLVHDITEDETVALVDRFVQEGRPRQVVTTNPEFVMAAQRNGEFRETINTADLAVPDGVGLVWAGRLLGTPFRGRVPGVELTWRLAALCAARGYRLYLLGAAPGVAEEAAHRLQGECPGLTIAGTHAGSPAPAEDDDLVTRIRSAAPHILLVAYGAPQQDLWLRRNLPHLGAVVGLGVGGTFDYISGRAARAPAWMRRMGLEWLYRLVTQPWRWRRMLALPAFGWKVFVRASQEHVR
jgi:N-acetylglucosaminyldiphosphoundecaprenol N-acetyl-beta-D-mannosaminyltransferase